MSLLGSGTSSHILLVLLLDFYFYYIICGGLIFEGLTYLVDVSCNATDFPIWCTKYQQFVCLVQVLQSPCESEIHSWGPRQCTNQTEMISLGVG